MLATVTIGTKANEVKGRLNSHPTFGIRKLETVASAVCKKNEDERLDSRGIKMDSATRRAKLNLRGNEIAAMKPYLDLCENYRNKTPETEQPGHRSRFDVFRTIHIALEHLVLYAIDVTNLVEALSFAEEAQDPGFYRTTILKHICIHIDDLDQRLNGQITGKPFQDAMRRIQATFSNLDSLRVPEDYNRLLGEYNQRMVRDGDRIYVHDIRNKIAAHTDSDIDAYININKSLDAERTRAIVHYTLTFVMGFLKTCDPLRSEVLD